MTRRIQILPDAVANQIAAGEAVERPASVVKELVENALDARASRIEVAIERGGTRRIRVSDDGVGMGREDSLLCLDRHATSKISTARDLTGVRTFGFRGEAIPSIAAVSRMTLETWDGEGEVGTRVLVQAGRITDVADVPRRRGTTVEVRNLFFNAPVRAKFLKAVSAETRAVSEAVTGLALANPQVSFLCTSDDRTLLDLPAASDAAGRIAQVWGADQGGTLIAASGSHNGLEVRGLVQRPDAAKPGVGRRYLFVNGRPFKASGLVQAAERGYRTTIPPGARPWFFMYLHVPGGDVDVNVHPTKAEVRFRESHVVEELVEQAIRDALDSEESAATFDSQIAVPPLVVREVGASRGPSSEPAADSQMALFVAGPAEEGEAGADTAAPAR